MPRCLEFTIDLDTPADGEPTQQGLRAVLVLDDHVEGLCTPDRRGFMCDRMEADLSAWRSSAQAQVRLRGRGAGHHASSSCRGSDLLQWVVLCCNRLRCRTSLSSALDADWSILCGVWQLSCCMLYAGLRVSNTPHATTLPTTLQASKQARRKGGLHSERRHFP